MRFKTGFLIVLYQHLVPSSGSLKEFFLVNVMNIFAGMLPKPVADDLRQGRTAEAQSFSNASVYFRLIHHLFYQNISIVINKVNKSLSTTVILLDSLNCRVPVLLTRLWIF